MRKGSFLIFVFKKQKILTYILGTILIFCIFSCLTTRKMVTPLPFILVLRCLLGLFWGLQDANRDKFTMLSFMNTRKQHKISAESSWSTIIQAVLKNVSRFPIFLTLPSMKRTLANSGGLTLLLANWLGSISLTLTLANVTCNYKHYDVSVKTVTSK